MSALTMSIPWMRGPGEERRLRMRASQPWLRVETEGFAYIVRDWSAGGTAISHFHSTSPIGALVSGTVGWSDTEALTPFRADIVRRDSDGCIVLRWLDIDATLLAEMNHLARHR
jgi:hypothetical protein